MSRLNSLSISVLKKNLDECSSTELRQLCNDYPYFAPLQLIYAKKLKQEGDRSYQAQLQKSFLYFSNPLWLDHLLSDSLAVVKTKQEVAEVSSHEEVSVVNTEANTAEENIAEVAEDTSNKSFILEESPENKNMSGSAVETKHAEINSEKEEAPASPEIESRETESANTDSQEILKENDKEEPQPIPSLKIEPATAPQAPLTFEPYHTVDYFASQGIRIKEEARPGDRFSQQLKSFTEWLKAMKRLPAPETESTTPESQKGEEKVEQMAALSIEDRDVVTEAMAEVWEKQGDRRKAREIYEKLSLLDPSKSAYFAAKIEALK